MAIKEIDITICGHGSGTPSLKRMDEYLASRYASKMANGLRKGVLYFMRLKALTDKKRQEFHDTYKTILGRNIYNQDRRTYVYTKYKDGKYYSDCSSSGCATLREIGYSVSLLNTVGIYESTLFEKVPVNIVEGHITNPEVLKVGDAILFAGNMSRPWANYIGHVEWVYEINGEVPGGKTTTTKQKKEETSAEYIGKVTADSLNIRANAGSQYKKVGTLKKGNYVWVKKIKNNWGYVNNLGWVSMKYISKQLKSVVGKVSVNALNVRYKAGDTRGDVKKVIKKGTEVAINLMNDAGTWGYDVIAGGWVSLKYIKF